MINLLADFIVRFNVSSKRNVEFFYTPYSNLNVRLVELLFKYNSIRSFCIDLCKITKKLRIKIFPIYVLSEPLIKNIELISKPSHRIYWTASELSLNFARNNFQGFYIVSTSQGICSSNELIAAQILEKPVSGEILLKINL